jgi:AcrR family transcriptional regulator
LSSRNRAPLEPQRHDGRQRVAELLQAAAAVIQERGFEATKMAEIAARADAKIGSLYRFFPNKDAVAEALMRQYAEALQRSTTPSMRPPPVLRRKNSPISSSI